MSLSTNLQDLATRISTEIKTLRTLINGNVADNSALTTTAKGNLVAAINELKAEVQAAAASGGASINDSTKSTTTTWSSNKIDSQIDSDVAAAVSALVNGAPLALDTLKELADALDAAATDAEVAVIVTALDNRVRFDAAQTLTGPQQVQARANIGAGTGTSNLTIGTTASTAAAGNHNHTAISLTDTTATGAAVMTAATALAARTAIGAGTSSLAIGTTSTTAKAGDYHPTAAQIIDSTTVGAAVITAADATAARTAIGAGTSSLAIGTTASTAKAGNYVPTWTEVSSKPTTFAPTAHTHTAAEISNATTVGRNVLTATDAAAARAAIGAGPGTSDLVIGTTASTAKAGNWVPTSADISDSTATGIAVMTAASQAAARTAIGAGTGNSNVAVGTGAANAKAGNWTPAVADINDASAVGKSVLLAATEAAARSAIGAGTSSLVVGTTAGTAAEGNDSRIVNAVPSTRTVAGKALSANVTLVAADVGALPSTYVPPVATAVVSGTNTLAGDLAGTGSTAATPRVISASTTVAGKVQLATSAEATTGTDALKAITPATLKTVADTKAPASHTHTAAQISDASAYGRSLLQTASAATARTLLDAASATEVGDTNTNFVTVFEAGLV